MNAYIIMQGYDLFIFLDYCVNSYPPIIRMTNAYAYMGGGTSAYVMRRGGLLCAYLLNG